MFGGYKFGNITRGVYNKVTNNQTTSIASNDAKGYQFGDVTKSIYNKWSNANYKFGDLTKSAFHSITGQYEPFKVDLGNAKILNEGFLYKRSLVLTYTEYWAILAEKFLYLFKAKNKYDQCVQAIDLSLYDGVAFISNSYDGFELISTSHDNQRYKSYGCCANDRSKWIECIMKIIGVRKADEIKESIMVNKTKCDKIVFDMQCVAYYIIGLEYNHSENGDPEILLNNQNFIISMIIWSYIHKENKAFDWNSIKDLDDNQLSALKVWQQPIAVSYAINSGVKKSIAAPLTGKSVGLMSGIMIGGIMMAVVSNHNNQNRMSLGVILPLSIIAAIAIQTAHTKSQ